MEIRQESPWQNLQIGVYEGFLFFLSTHKNLHNEKQDDLAGPYGRTAGQYKSPFWFLGFVFAYLV